jgi:hypothetical protein
MILENIKSALVVILLSTAVSACAGSNEVLIVDTNNLGGDINNADDATLRANGWARRCDLTREEDCIISMDFTANESLTNITKEENLNTFVSVISFDMADDGSISNAHISSEDDINGDLTIFKNGNMDFGVRARMFPEEVVTTGSVAGSIKPDSATVITPALSLPPPPQPFEIRLTTALTSDNIDENASDDSFRVYRTMTEEGQPLNLTMLIPGDPVYDYSYVTMGVWSGESLNENDISYGALVFGIDHVAQMPLTGTGEYNGFTRGWLATTETFYSLTGDANITIDFADDTLGALFSNMQKKDIETGVLNAWNDFSAAGTLNNFFRFLFDGTTSNESGSMTGGIEGSIFNNEIGGVWTLAGDEGQATGAFLAKQDGGP